MHARSAILVGVAVEAVQHRARLRIIHPQLAASRLGHEPGLLAVRRHEGQSPGNGVFKAFELSVQLAGPLIPHPEPPLLAPDMSSSRQGHRGAQSPWLSAVLTTHPVTSLVAARGLLVHGQARNGASLSAGLDGVEQLEVVAVPDAQVASIKGSGDTGAAVRGPLVGEEALINVPRIGGFQSLQEGAGAGVPRAQDVIGPQNGDQSGRALTGRGVRTDHADCLIARRASPRVDLSRAALRRPRLRTHRRQVRQTGAASQPPPEVRL
jgi:hypothetical protein